VVIHDAIARALADRGLPTPFLYGIDDLDPMDSATLATREGLSEYMGMPLARVPAPHGSDHPSWARHFAQTFLDTFEQLGVRTELYWASEQYAAGDYDDFIRQALDRAADVRRVYAEVSNVRHGDAWLPLQVICEQCGRIGTTFADDWDGATVHLPLPAGAGDLGGRLRTRGPRGARSAVPPSCRGTCTGSRSGGISGSPSRERARTWPPPAARGTDPRHWPARCSTSRHRATCRTSS